MSASSALSPEFDKARIASSAPIMPRSPWLASAGMDELRRRAGRGQRRGDLARDMAALADPGDDQPAARRRAQIERAPERAVERSRASRSRPAISARMHTSADIEIAGQRAVPSLPSARAAFVRRSAGGSIFPKSGSGLWPDWSAPCRATRQRSFPPRQLPRIRSRPVHRRASPKHSMRENVLLGPAFQVKQSACRQEIEAAARQLGASLARQHRIESRPQRVQVQHVGGGIAQLLLGQRRRAPVRALLFLLEDRRRAGPCTDRATRAGR